MNGTASLEPPFDRFERGAAIAGVAVTLVCFAGGWFRPQQFFHSYLMAFLYWLGIALGCSAVLMLHHLVGGWWGFIIRRPLECGMATLPLMAILFVPILFGLRILYPWARPEEVARDQHLQHNQIYLNFPFFLARAALYFASWLILGYLLNKWSLDQDRTADPAVTRQLQNLSGPGLVIYFLTLTYASIDWVMSLEPHWFSTIYGIIYLVGEVLSSLALAIVIVMLLHNRRPLSSVITPEHLRDLGNLMLTFVMLWAYIQFSQFLIIWAGNLTDEIPWYLPRTRGGWGWIVSLLILFHFFVPFFLLLSRDIKDRVDRLAKLAAAMLVVRLLDHFWLIAPALHRDALHIDWMDLAAPAGIGGLWVAVFLRRLRSAPLVPLNDPRLAQLQAEQHA